MRRQSGCFCVTLLVLLIVAFARPVHADVTGNFSLNLTLIPEGVQTESTKYFIDLQTFLRLNLTLSGITLSPDLVYGVTGSEYAILGLQTSLGALSISDEFVFGTPFYNSGGGPKNIHPTFNADGEPNGLTFVKKRVRTEANIAGFTLSNLAIFEDVDFPSPFEPVDDAGDGLVDEDPPDDDGDGLVDEDPLNGIDDDGDGLVDEDPLEGVDNDGDGQVDEDGIGGIGNNSPVYFPNQINNVVGDQTPTFGFGDVITLRGETVSGIRVTSETFLCASRTANTIKKRAWPESVNPACTAGFGFNDPDFVIEDGAKTPLMFVEELLSLANLTFGGFTFDVTATFKPLEPVAGRLNFRFSLFDFANVRGTLELEDITQLDLKSISLRIQSGNMTLTLFDADADVVFESGSLFAQFTLNPNQNPASLLSITSFSKGFGVTSQSLTLSISRGPFSWQSTTTFSPQGGVLQWANTNFNMSVSVPNGVVLRAGFAYTPAGVTSSVLQVGIVF